MGGNWGAQFTYDFSSVYYDDGYIDRKPTPDLQFNFGLREVAVAYEERFSSGNLKGPERSGATRHFVEGNNGRRLGAASYRIGAFLDGKKQLNSATNLNYTAAITDPQRGETFTAASAAGDSTSNKPAFWGTLALYRKLPGNGYWTAGVGAGFQPDRGGWGTTNFGRGFDLTLYSAYFDLPAGRFGLMAEYLTADVEKGVSATRDARPRGFFVMPIVNTNSPIAKPTLRQVDQIFTGDVTDWSAVGGKPGKTSIYTRNTSSGTYSDWKDLAMKKRDYARSSQKMAGNEQIAAEVAKNPNGVGDVGLAYIPAEGIKVVAIDGVIPSAAPGAASSSKHRSAGGLGGELRPAGGFFHPPVPVRSTYA